jgi:hypothetical protein
MPKEPASGSSRRPPQQIDPDQRELQDIQAKRLAELSGLSAEKLKGRKLRDLLDELRWRVDPHLLLFRRVCGQVVKRNPATNELEGVPNATVHVEDTDCSFHIYSPPGWPMWSWFFPFKCKREVIATAHTDQCGRFCVWIPRWDIDWVIKWRKGRICFPNFYRLRLRDYLERILKPDLTPEPPRIRPLRPPEATPIPLPIPRPEPDGPVFLKARMASALRRPDVVARLREVASEAVANRLASLAVRADFGAESKMLDAELETPVIPLPPPQPERSGRGEQNFPADLREKFGEVNFNNWIGPFRRCIDIIFGVWTPVFDVPDITFKVTQDVDSDGTEEVIYSEGFFDVRWDEGPMADVVIEAFANAVSSPICEGPQIGECPKPAIVTAGLMSLQAPHFDLASGYAKFVNRPRAGGISTGARAGTSTAPMWSTVQLHGCHRFPNAAFYRIMRKYGGAGSFQPILGETWWAPRLGGGAPILIAPDASGWYPVLPAADLVFPHWLLNWQTWLYANGRYDLQLELGNAAKAVIDTSAAVPMQIDNTRPNATFTQLRWRVFGGGGWTPLPDACPVIRRPAGGDIEIEVSCETSAAHFRNALLWGAGCDGTALAHLDSADKYDRWHTGPADNSWTTTARFLVAGSAEDGAYTFGLDSQSRAFNPAGGDSGPSTNWDYDPVYSWTHIRRHVAIVDL